MSRDTQLSLWLRLPEGFNLRADFENKCVFWSGTKKRKTQTCMHDRSKVSTIQNSALKFQDIRFRQLIVSGTHPELFNEKSSLSWKEAFRYPFRVLWLDL